VLRFGLTGAAVIAILTAITALGAFLATERSREAPMLPLELFRRPSFAAANAVAWAMLGTLGMLFVLTLYLQQVQHRSALAAGIAVIPLFLPLSVLAPIAGRATGRLGPKLPMAAGLLSCAAGVALLTRLSPDCRYARDLLPGLLLWKLGLAILTPAVVAAAMDAVPAARAGLASVINNTARVAGSRDRRARRDRRRPRDTERLS
jgi:DHA2 family methylenomycin A resistance protein-like MFS transporter